MFRVFRMFRKFPIAPLTLLAITVFASSADASSVHFKAKSGPTLRDNGLTATVQSCLAGLGNGDVIVTVSARGQGTTRCRNQGGNEAPGQNKVPLLLTGSQTISATEIKNGTVCFSVTTAGPGEPTAAEAGCPNNTWDSYFVDVAFTGYTVTVVQGGQVVLTRSVGS